MTGKGVQRPEGPLQKPYSLCFLTSTSKQPIQEGSALHPGSIPGQCKHLLAHLGLPHSLLKANLVPSVLMDPDASRTSADVTVPRWSRYHLQKMLMTELLSPGGSWPRPLPLAWPSDALCSQPPWHSYTNSEGLAEVYTENDGVRGSLTAWWVPCVSGQGSRGLCGHSVGSQRGWEAGHRIRNDNPVSTYKAQTSGPVSQRGTQWERLCGYQ